MPITQGELHQPVPIRTQPPTALIVAFSGPFWSAVWWAACSWINKKGIPTPNIIDSVCHRQGFWISIGKISSSSSLFFLHVLIRAFLFFFRQWSPFNRWENWGPGGLNALPKITCLPNARVRMRIQVLQIPTLCSVYWTIILRLQQTLIKCL